MWHEARKQEKKLRGMIVDYRKRAERRREFYEKFKADPTQFMQVHGRPCKIYMDPTITTAADNSLMPWQGNKETIIDRFDVRAHLEYIPEAARPTAGSSEPVNLDGDVDSIGELNYERYRILIQNEFTNVSEDKFLHQIHIEEQYGTTTTKDTKSVKSVSQPKAAIAYNYEDSSPVIPSNAFIAHSRVETIGNEDESDEDLDFDLLINVSDLNSLQKVELNNSGTKFGLKNVEFLKYLTNDVKERENLKLMKLQEEEKQHLSGRKARRERRAYKERQLSRRDYSPPSYAASSTEPVTETLQKRSSSESDSSHSPERVTYITSFGPKNNESESIFGPYLPNRYNRNKPGYATRRRRHTSTSSSSSDERRSRNKRSSYRRRRGHRRGFHSSSSSISSSSSDASSHRKYRKKSPLSQGGIRKRDDKRSSYSDTESQTDSKESDHQERSSSRKKVLVQVVLMRKERIKRRPKSDSDSGAAASSAATSTIKLTPQERLKRKMQIALSKQLKADKDAERVRNERLEQERLDREESLREISIKYRRKERERRHEEKSGSSSESERSRRSSSRDSA